MPRRGDVIGERYRLLEPLAKGGMGTVWRAHHTELDVDVALKMMSPGSAAAATGEQRFRREAQAAARLRSPHIVQVLDFGIHEEQPYLAMELMQGEDLETRLARQGTLPPEPCAKIVDGVAKALELAHDGDIVHRDLKPANIFLAQVGGEEIAKVLDFGVAKDTRMGTAPTSTTADGVVGSPAYMSPEQVWGEPLDRTTDLWSLAVVAFEMLVGSNPFADDTMAKVFERIIRDDLPRPSDYDPDLSPAVDAFFERALAREPAERFASARQFAATFRAAVIDGTTITAPSAPVVAKADSTVTDTTSAPTTASPAPAAPRRRWMTALLVVVAAALVTLIVARRSPSVSTGEDAPAGTVERGLTSAAAVAPLPTTTMPIPTAEPAASASWPKTSATASSEAPVRSAAPAASVPRTMPTPASTVPPSHPPATTPKPTTATPAGSTKPPARKVDPFTGIPLDEP